MAQFEPAHNLTAGLEGGESNHPLDSGGHTRYGITKGLFKDYRKAYGYKGDFNDLTPQMSREIGRLMFWEPINGYAIKSQMIANELYDMVFNHGTGRGVKILQKAVNKFHRALNKPKIKVDGKIGDATRGAVNFITVKYEPNFFKCLNVQRGIFFNNLVLIKPSQWVFYIGWMLRC